MLCRCRLSRQLVVHRFRHGGLTARLPSTNEHAFGCEGVEDVEVVDRLRETERAIAVLHAERLDLIAEIYRRTHRWITAAAETPGLVDAGQVAAAEVGVALRISRRSAMDRLGLALQAVHDLPDTLSALRRGELSLAKVRLIAEATAVLAAEPARQVQERVLPRVGRQTPAGIAASLARAVLAADPDAAARRHAEAVRERAVRFFPGPDGMASLWARCPPRTPCAATANSAKSPTPPPHPTAPHPTAPHPVPPGAAAGRQRAAQPSMTGPPTPAASTPSST